MGVELIYFLSGVAFVLLVLPVIESLVDLVAIAIEVGKAHLGLKVLKLNAEGRKYTDEEEEEPQRRIGFYVEDDKEDYVEYDD